MSEKLDELRAEIPMSSPVQRFFDQLDDSHQDTLAGLVLDAVEDQEQRIDEASEAALKLVPGILRGRMKSLLFGGKS